jgi:hypothetical protein
LVSFGGERVGFRREVGRLCLGEQSADLGQHSGISAIARLISADRQPWQTPDHECGELGGHNRSVEREAPAAAPRLDAVVQVFNQIGRVPIRNATEDVEEVGLAPSVGARLGDGVSQLALDL